MNRTGDLRVQRTYRLLFDAFTSLLEEVGFDSVSVQQLCDRAMIRRTTFYKHFADKYEYLYYYMQQICEEFKHNGAACEGESLREYLLRMNRQLIRFLNSHRAMVQRGFQGGMPTVLLETLSTIMHENILAFLDEEKARGYLPPVSSDLFASFYIGGFLLTIYRSIEQKKYLDEDELIQVFDKFLPPLSPHNEIPQTKKEI